MAGPWIWNDESPHLCQLVRETTYGTDPGGGYLYNPIIGISGLDGMARFMIPDERKRQGMEPLPHLAGQSGYLKPGASFTTRNYLHGLSASAYANQAAITAVSTSLMSELLRFAIGEWFVGDRTTVAAGAAVQVVTVTSAANLRAGCGAIINVDALAPGTDDWEFAFLTARNEVPVPDTVTTRIDLSAIPVVDAEFFSPMTYYVTQRGAYSATIRWFGHKIVGEDSPLQFVARGCKCSKAKLIWEPDKFPVIEIEWLAGGGEWSTNAAVNLTEQTYSYPDPVQAVGMLCELATAHDASADWTPKTLTVEIDHGAVVAASPAAGTDGVIDIYWTKEDVKVSGDRILDANPMRTQYEAQTEYVWQASHGAGPGTMMGMCIPRCTIAELKYLVSGEGGLASEEFTLVANRQTADTPTTDTPANAPFAFSV